ncbi:MAG TPA: cobalamin-dependent protein [Candidatus Krumholzibacteria bacterium]|nr:cobalamin-dependent protein [Candidatus Krumholzibacteria bacterium]
MRIILFNPPRYVSGDHHKFNNALLWLASYLHRRGVEVRIVPLNHAGFADTVAEEIATFKPQFAAVCCKWWDTLYSSSHIASLIKKQDPRVVTIAGGQTATFFATDVVARTDFDVVIRGDGEEPLYRLVSGQEPQNSVFKTRPVVPDKNSWYVQTEESFADTFLEENLEDIVSDVSVLNSYIWTGKGCVESCAYCSANAWNNKQSFGRARFIYRPIEQILREIDILGKYPDGGRITFDFDPLRGNIDEDYHLRLLAALEKKKHNVYFCSWSLPSKQLVDALAETFNFVELCIDVQTCSERLRRVLGQKRYLKAFFSDAELDDVLQHCRQYDNFTIDLSTLMGLPFEEDEDIEAIPRFSDLVYDKFSDVRYPYVSPMNVEPGSMLLRDPAKYDMVLMRSTFDDFFQYTKRSFENNINCYQPKEYGPGIYHPLGVVPRRDHESGDIFRVYETWKKVQEHVDKRSEEKLLIRARKYRKYGLLKAGIQGGIDRPTLARSEVE